METGERWESRMCWLLNEKVVHVDDATDAYVIHNTLDQIELK